jgi:hypothetical protein
LVIREPHPPTANLLPQNTIFLDEIFDHLLLTLIDPTGKRQQEMKMDSDPLASSHTSTLTQAAILLKSDRVSVFGRYGFASIFFAPRIPFTSTIANHSRLDKSAHRNDRN